MNDDELREELDFHLEQRSKLLEATGRTPEQARREARLMLGNPATLKEDMRNMHVSVWLETVAQDLRYAARSYLRTPSLAVTAVLAIALGVGACTAVFSVVDLILFRPLPYKDPERLVSFGLRAPIEPTEFMLAPDYQEWRTQTLPFETVTSWRGTSSCDLTGLQSPLRLRCARVEANMLPALGVTPHLGRAFTAEEDRPNQPKVALLSDGLWRQHFGADPAVVGRTIALDGEGARVVGVLPAAFELPTLNRFDILVPQALDPPATGRANMTVVRAFARLKEGVTIEQARQQMAPLLQAALQHVPFGFRKEVKLEIRPLRERQVGDSARVWLILFGAVSVVLLLACLNVASLLLARATARQQETSIRLAIGASRPRLLRQMLTEAALLTFVGGAAGCALAWCFLAISRAYAPAALLRVNDARLDLRVLMFAMLCSVAAAIACSILPAFASLRLRKQSQGLAQQSLVAAQIAMCVLLLSGATLLLRTLWNLQNANLGIDQEHVITANLVLGRSHFPQPDTRAAFFNEVENRIAALPGVEAVAVADSIPPSGQMQTMIYSLIEIAGRPPAQQGTGGMVAWRAVSPDYFKVLGIRIEQGRSFQADDRRTGDAMILSRSLAARLFHNQAALHQKIRTGRAGPWRTVVGIASDVANSGVRGKPEPEYYVVRPLNADPANTALSRATVLLRSRLAPAALVPAIRHEIGSLAPNLPVEVETMRSRVLDLAEGPRFQAVVLTCFAAIALALAAIGLYGVVSFLVVQRTREVGIRIAVGATPDRVRRLVIGGAARIVVAGLVAGLLLTLPATAVLRQMLFGVAERDPLALTTAVGVLAIAGFVAAYFPARRASRVDPVVALRHE